MSGVIKVNSLPKPFGQYILVKREKPEEETRDSGIIIPHQHRKLSQLGDIIDLCSHSRVTKKGKKNNNTNSFFIASSAGITQFR